MKLKHDKLEKSIQEVIDNLNKDNVIRLDRHYIEHAYKMFDMYAKLVAHMEANGVYRHLIKELAEDDSGAYS